MKKFSSRWILMVSASLIICLSTVQTTQAQANVSLQTFYDELQPYGTWINHNQYGYVWSPNVDAGFTPYSTNGYWVNTSYGNTWVSDYSWGWAPFHYGRWFFDDYNGWLWMPETTWAPAWVAWRSGGGYYGWAPLMPGFGINVSVGYYNGIPHNYWSFVPCRYVMYRNAYHHRVSGPRVVNVINNTTIINNYNNYNDNGHGGRDRSYFTGPSRNEIEQRNHERVPVYDVDDRTRPGRTEVGRNSVAMYRPAGDNSRSSKDNEVPSRWVNDKRTTVVGSESSTHPQTTMPRDVRGSQVRTDAVNSQNNTSNRATPTERSNFDRRPSDQTGQGNNGRVINNTDALDRQQRTNQSQNIDNIRHEQSIERVQREQNNQRQQSIERIQQQSQQNQMRTPARGERSGGLPMQRSNPQQNQIQNQVKQQTPRTNFERGSSVQRTSPAPTRISTPTRQGDSRSSSRRGIH
ncbi:MAG: DUF6600 domain-containing protein [Chryseolinea sp.]